MKIHQGDLSKLAPLKAAVGLTIGNFDGLHKGHQILVERLKQTASESRVQTAVLCFSPHPEAILGPGIEMLTSVTEKARLLEAMGVDHMVIQNFDSSFAQVSAEDFLRQYLQRFFNLHSILVGYDFRFGSGGKGGFALLENFFGPTGVPCQELQPQKLGGQTISSTLIRQSLLLGKIEQANLFLGREYTLIGKVEKGQQLGRTMGFPTANLADVQTIVPQNGVYLCRVIFEGKQHQALCNIGTKPTVGNNKKNLEVHILDFEADLYHKKIEVRFLKKIRDEKKFENLDMLKSQIEKDVNLARNHFVEKNQ